jgi:hypothetical protein
LSKFGDDTRLNKLGVETNPKRFGVDIKGKIEEANSLGSIKLLIYCSNPAVVETSEERRDKVEIYPKEPKVLAKFKRRVSRKVVLTKSRRFGEETKLSRFGEDTRLIKLGLEIKDNKLGDEIRLNRFGLEIKPNKLGVEMNPLMDET